MVRATIHIALFLLTMGCTVPAAEPNVQSALMAVRPPEEVFDSLFEQEPASWTTLLNEPGTLVFGGQDTVRTGLHELELMKEFSAPSGSQWYLFRAGAASKSSEKAMSMYILSPDKEKRSQATHEPWHMPGRLFDGPNENSYYEAEVFAGEVLPDTIGVIWYDRSLMPDGEWKQNTVLLNLNGPETDTLVFFGHGRKSSTIYLAFHGKCEMLQSVDQHIRP